MAGRLEPARQVAGRPLTTGVGYPGTRISVIVAARERDPDLRRAAFESLVTVYWRPVYGRLRLKWHREPADAEDLTQEFFARAMERGFFDGYDPDRARFRTYLRTCLDRFAANARRDERRLKRGGGVAPVRVEAASVERDLAASAPAADADQWFDREWVRSLFQQGIEALREATAGTPREIRFRILVRHDLLPAGEPERPSYRALAEELAIPVTQVTNHLAWARRELRRLMLERLSALCGSDAELREEAESLLGRPLP
jgi:RNA polymerase sigma factor (sigma-70 family)